MVNEKFPKKIKLYNVPSPVLTVGIKYWPHHSPKTNRLFSLGSAGKFEID